MFNELMEKRMDLVRNHFKWYDMSLVKISTFIFALLIANSFLMKEPIEKSVPIVSSLIVLFSKIIFGFFVLIPTVKLL